MPKKKKTTKLTLSDFQQEGGGGYDANALPTGPSGISRDRDYGGGRGGGGRYERDDGYGRADAGDWGRNRRDEDDNSRADDSGDWRSVGRRGDTRGRNNYDRYDRDRDRNYGGDRYGGDSGGYKRLNLQRRGEANDSSQDIRKKNDSDSKLDEEKAPKSNVERKFALDDVATVTVDNKQTALEKALALNQEVNADDLAAGLAKLDLNAADKEQLYDCIAKSVLNNKVSLAEVVDSVKKTQEDDAAEFLVDVLRSLKTKFGEIDFVKHIRTSNVDVLAAIAPGLEGGALNTFLESKRLSVLKPVPKLDSFVDKAFQDGESPADVLKHISDSVDSNLCISELTSNCVKALASKIFADKAKPNTDVIEGFVQLLTRVMCRPDDFAAQKECLFILQGAWFEAGKPKGMVKKIFTELYDNGVVAVEAVNMWKEDTKNKTKGKMPALLQTNSWIEEIQPIEDEGDEGDADDKEVEEEETGEDLLQNPNKEF